MQTVESTVSVCVCVCVEVVQCNLGHGDLLNLQLERYLRRVVIIYEHETLIVDFSDPALYRDAFLINLTAMHCS